MVINAQKRCLFSLSFCLFYSSVLICPKTPPAGVVALDLAGVAEEEGGPRGKLNSVGSVESDSTACSTRPSTPPLDLVGDSKKPRRLAIVLHTSTPMGGVGSCVVNARRLTHDHEAVDDVLPSGGIGASRRSDRPPIPLLTPRLTEDTTEESVGFEASGVVVDEAPIVYSSIDPDCKKYAYVRPANPYELGKQKGLESFDDLARRISAVEDALRFQVALYKCIADCGRNIQSPNISSEHSDDARRVLREKTIVFWKSFRTAVIARYPESIELGVIHGKMHFEKLKKAGSDLFIEVAKRCLTRMEECFSPCFEPAQNMANLRYWAARRMMFVACALESLPIKKTFDYNAAGMEDGRCRFHVSVVPELLAFCDKPITYLAKFKHPQARAMLSYWVGFKAGLEECAKLTDS